jgi:type I restriction enzyme M protein
MNVQIHESLKSDIWEIANRLRGPYRPPQYRLVMLPIIVLRRLDCLLEPTKDAVLKEFQKLTKQKTPQSAMEKLLGRAANKARKHPLYNTSPFTFSRLLGDPENIAPNLVSYINGFSPIARSIFERFKFSDQIEKLDSSNRLFTIVKAMADVDLHPDRIDNLQMGYLFEHLVMRFNEQAMHELGGRAKAMVVTGSRLAAVKYKLAFDRYIKDHGYTGIRSLVAFSGRHLCCRA